MCRAVLTALLGVILVLRGTIALPHAHCESHVALPPGHDQRPHIHVLGHYHAHHHQQHASHKHTASKGIVGQSTDHLADRVLPAHPGPDHDSDAFYLVDAAPGGPKSSELQSLAANPLACVTPSDFGWALPTGWQPASGPPLHGQRVPVFLQVSKLLL